MTEQSLSTRTRTQLIDASDQTLTCRTFGNGTPLVLCVRFRGTTDSSDPLFLDSLADLGFQVTVIERPLALPSKGDL